jgi:D-amino peptidase
LKLYISADIEGVTGILSWKDVTSNGLHYSKYAKQMTKEVLAACEGAKHAGVKEILVNDAHDEGRNLDISILHEDIKVIQGFSGHPYCMMQEIDETFDAVAFIGYHSYGTSPENPLSHTLHPKVRYIKINDKFVSEFTINSYTASMLNIPVVFISGDEGVCKEAEIINNNISTVSVSKYVGKSNISLHPDKSLELIEKNMELALKKDINKCIINMPEYFKVEICYNRHINAYKASFYPGVKLVSPTSILYTSNKYFDVLTMFNFLT